MRMLECKVIMIRRYAIFVQQTTIVTWLCVYTTGQVMEQSFCLMKKWKSCMAPNGTGSILTLSLIRWIIFMVDAVFSVNRFVFHLHCMTSTLYTSFNDLITE